MFQLEAKLLGIKLSCYPIFDRRVPQVILLKKKLEN